MAIIATDNKKQYELAPSGQYIGVLADVVDLGIIKTNFGEKPKTRLVWILGKVDNTGFILDKEGQPLRVMGEYTLSMNERSTLFQTVRSILGTNPPAGPYDIEQLLGRNNLLFIVQEPSPKDATKLYANVKGIIPLPPGVNPLSIPSTFKRYTPRPTQQLNVPPATQGAPFTPVVAQPVTVSAPLPNAVATSSPQPAAGVVAQGPQNQVDVQF